MNKDTGDILNEVGQKVHELFIKNIYEDTTDEALASIFQYLETYWFDRDRTALIWFSNQISGGIPEKTAILSLIISLTSSGIGIHDDVIDKTRIKQFKKTIPLVFGAENAIIAGDLLIIKGLLSSELLLDTFDHDTFHTLMKVLSDYFSEMAIGELWEVSAKRNLDIELDDYLEMLWKLGADGSACTRLGAVSGGANRDQQEALGLFGQTLGYIIRLNDEIKDILNAEGNLINRIKNESIPLALLYTSKHSSNHYYKIHNIVHKEIIELEDIRTIIDMCYEANLFNYINEKIDDSYLKALKALEIFPDSHAKEMLLTILEIKKDQKELRY